MEDVGTDRASRAQAFQGNLHTEAEIRVGLHNGGDGRDGVRVGGHQRLAGHAEQGGNLVEVGTERIGQHDALGGIVHAGTQDCLAVGRDLKDLVGRVGLDQGVEGGVARAEVRQHLGEDGFERQHLDHGRGREGAEIDGGEGCH